MSNRLRRIRVKLGKRIKVLRERRDMTQVEVAELTGLDKTYISQVENGRVNMTLRQMDRIAQALECTIAVLVKDVDN